jgi:hypothetical protein
MPYLCAPMEESFVPSIFWDLGEPESSCHPCHSAIKRLTIGWRLYYLFIYADGDGITESKTSSLLPPPISPFIFLRYRASLQYSWRLPRTLFFHQRLSVWGLVTHVIDIAHSIVIRIELCPRVVLNFSYLASFCCQKSARLCSETTQVDTDA